MVDDFDDTPEENVQIDVTEKLLEEYRTNREALTKMLDDIEKVKNQIESLFPKSLEQRYAHLLEQKVKAAFQIFSTLLEVRKEISKSIKDEIEIRRKIDVGAELNEDVNFDIREISEKVEALKKIKAV